MPLCLAVEYWSAAPPNENCFSDLPGQTVPGAVSDLGLVQGLVILVGNGLVLQDE